MARTPDNMTPKRNATEERLRATPFGDPKELSLEEKSIRLAVWRRFTESKIIDELLTKPEFKHVLEELNAGLSCSLRGDPRDDIYKIFSDGRGMKLEVNKKLADSLGEHQAEFFQGVVQAGIEGYGSIYMQVKGLLSRNNLDLETIQKPKKSGR